MISFFFFFSSICRLLGPILDGKFFFGLKALSYHPFPYIVAFLEDLGPVGAILWVSYRSTGVVLTEISEWKLADSIRELDLDRGLAWLWPI